MNLKELSNILGISQTTVSRALNGYPEVSEATRQKVSAAALQYNYTPNTRARSLATGLNHTVGHVIPLSETNEVGNPIFTDFIAGASEIYAAHNFDMHITMASRDEQEDVYRKLALKGSVDGVIIHGPKPNDPRITLLQELGLPFVVHGRSISEKEENYSWVDVNNKRSFEAATKHLIDLGHRRIALLNGLESMGFAQRRRAGYEAAHQKAHITIDENLCTNEEMTEEYGFRIANQMLSFKNPPSAFIASSIISGYGIRRAIEARHLRIKEDISVVIHDDELSYLRNGYEDTPVFTCTRSSVRKAGNICAEMLINKIKHPQSPVTSQLLEAELIIGNSTGPCSS